MAAVQRLITKVGRGTFFMVKWPLPAFRSMLSKYLKPCLLFCALGRCPSEIFASTLLYMLKFRHCYFSIAFSFLLDLEWDNSCALDFGLSWLFYSGGVMLGAFLFLEYLLMTLWQAHCILFDCILPDWLVALRFFNLTMETGYFPLYVIMQQWRERTASKRGSQAELLKTNVGGQWTLQRAWASPEEAVILPLWASPRGS